MSPPFTPTPPPASYHSRRRARGQHIPTPSLFHIKTLDASGQLHERIDMYTSPLELAHSVDDMGHTLLKVHDLSTHTSPLARIFKRSLYNFGRISAPHISTFFLRLSILLAAGRPLLLALNDTRLSENHSPLRVLIHIMMERLKNGEDFVDILESYPHMIARPMLLILRAGMATGCLEKSLNVVHAHMNDTINMRKKLYQALIYPLFLALMSLVLIIGFTQFLLPHLTDFLHNMGVRELPLASRILIKCAHFIEHYGVIVGGVFGGIMTLLIVFAYHPLGQSILMQFLMQLPGVGPCVRITWSAPWLWTLGILYEAGIDFKTSLTEAQKTARNTYTRSRFNDLTRRVLNGTPLEEAMRGTGIFSYFTTSLCGVGLNSGQLSHYILQAYTLEKEQLDHTLNRLVRVIEPIFIVIMGGLVLWMVLAVIVPLYTHIDA